MESCTPVRVRSFIDPSTGTDVVGRHFMISSHEFLDDVDTAGGGYSVENLEFAEVAELVRQLDSGQIEMAEGAVTISCDFGVTIGSVRDAAAVFPTTRDISIVFKLGCNGLDDYPARGVVDVLVTKGGEFLVRGYADSMLTSGGPERWKAEWMNLYSAFRPLAITFTNLGATRRETLIAFKELVQSTYGVKSVKLYGHQSTSEWAELAAAVLEYSGAKQVVVSARS